MSDDSAEANSRDFKTGDGADIAQEIDDIVKSGKDIPSSDVLPEENPPLDAPTPTADMVEAYLVAREPELDRKDAAAPPKGIFDSDENRFNEADKNVLRIILMKAKMSLLRGTDPITKDQMREEIKHIYNRIHESIDNYPPSLSMIRDNLLDYFTRAAHIFENEPDRVARCKSIVDTLNSLFDQTASA